jgi:hypothetical protein
LLTAVAGGSEEASIVVFFVLYDVWIAGRWLIFHWFKMLAGVDCGTHNIPYTLIPGNPAYVG